MGDIHIILNRMKRLNFCKYAIFSVLSLVPIVLISRRDDRENNAWIIRGLDETIKCTIKIFDRFGKIFVDSEPSSTNNYVWNGRYKGEVVPSSNYWYIKTAQSQEKVDLKYIGHFSVRK